MISPNLPSASHLISKIKTDSIINPLLWASIPIFLLFGTGFFTLPGWKAIVCIIVCVFWVFCIAFSYGYFALRDPDRLHSEEHQREIKKMDMDASKSGQHVLTAPTIDAEVGSLLMRDETPDDGKSDLMAESN